MYILGINAYHADSSAAIFKDGKLIAATEEERFRRIKHWAGFPSQAIEFCLREAAITLSQVDHIAIGRDPYAKLTKKILFLLMHPVGSWSAVADRFNNSKKVLSIEDEFALIDDTIDKKELKTKIHQVEHHRSHLASAFFASPFNEAALLSIDGSGDFTTTMTGVGTGNKIKILDSVDFPHSVGIFYTAFTQWLGFPHYGDEYKLMGLAPYGEAKYVEQLRDVLSFKENGLFAVNLKYFRSATSGIITYGEDHIPKVASLYVYNQILNYPKIEPIYTAYTGSRFSGNEIEQYLQSRKIAYTKYDNEELFERAADCLVNGGVVGWFNGRAEFGPRALGARSILADPRRADAKDLLNSKIKRRESFRPFAPSILREYVSEYFEVTDDVPFMEKVFPIKAEKHKLIPAVTHVDGTGRLQTVDKNVSPDYYQLIDTFRRKTGVPILLNTSFNENEPIVNSPEHALECFLRTNMDMLVLENCIITR